MGVALCERTCRSGAERVLPSVSLCVLVRYLSSAKRAFSAALVRRRRFADFTALMTDTLVRTGQIGTSRDDR